MSWLGAYAISYEMGVDGLSTLLVLLVAIVFPVVIGIEWNQKAGRRGMYGLFLALQGAFFGVACSHDLFLLFFFWAFTALPIYFLLGIWGGAGREAAAFRAIVSSSIGNALVLAALILVYYSVDPHTFLLRDLSGMKFSTKVFEFLGKEFSVPAVAFFLIGVGLALRAAIWPLHGWFIQVSKEAPSSIFIVIGAVTLPTALYLFMRLTYTLFPEMSAQWAGAVVLVGSLNLVIGGLSAVVQRELRTLAAYICLTTVGFALLGVGSLDPAGVVGAIYSQLAMGLGITGFAIFSGVIHDRAGHSFFSPSDLESEGLTKKGKLGGLVVKAPAIALFSAAFVISLLGLPGMGGFIGNSLIIIGTFPAHPIAVVLAMGATLLAGYYLFMMYRLIFLGKADPETPISDLTLRERACLIPLVLALLIAGVHPKPLLELVRPTALTLLSTMK